MPSFNTYDPSDMVLVLNGILIGGFAPDTFITIERSTETFTKTAGANGDVTRTRNRDKTGTVTFRLMAASASNARLTALAKLDELFGTGYGELTCTQLSSSDVTRAPNAWVEKRPTIERGTDAPMIEWVIGCDQLEPDAGSALNLI